MTLAWLDNIAWHSLCGAQAHLAAGSATARRYARGLAPIVAFADLQHPDFAALAPHCDAGERVYSSSWSGPAPAGWQIEADARMLQMLWQGPAPVVDEGFTALPLRPDQAEQMLALQTLTKPGPFGPRTLEFGAYLGCFEGPRLVAMAGERMHAGTLREISSVCTDPEFQGRGLARRLTQLLVRQQLQRGETPFLHVMRDNHAAHALYQRMGFRDHQELTVRVLSRLA